MNTFRTLTLLGAVALLPLQALAADTVPASKPAVAAAPAADSAPAKGKGFERYWGKLDPEGKGFVTKEQWEANADKRFQKIDANNDGKVSKEELQAYDAKMRDHFREMREHRKAMQDAAPAEGN